MEHGDSRTHKQVLVLRKDLGMAKGKCVAQGSHASLGAVLSRAVLVRLAGWRRYMAKLLGMPTEHDVLCIPMDADIGPWLSGRFAKICVSVPDEEALLQVYEKALAAGVPCTLIRDSGLTQFQGIPTLTAVGIGPARIEQIDPLTCEFSLLGGRSPRTTTFGDLYAGDRFYTSAGRGSDQRILWSKLDVDTARKHSKGSIALAERGYGYGGDAVCSFDLDDPVEFSPVTAQ